MVPMGLLDPLPLAAFNDCESASRQWAQPKPRLAAPRLLLGMAQSRICARASTPFSPGLHHATYIGPSRSMVTLRKRSLRTLPTPPHNPEDPPLAHTISLAVWLARGCALIVPHTLPRYRTVVALPPLLHPGTVRHTDRPRGVSRPDTRHAPSARCQAGPCACVLIGRRMVWGRRSIEPPRNRPPIPRCTPPHPAVLVPDTPDRPRQDF